MTTLRINFDGDASRLIAEHRKMLAELRKEASERRGNEAEARRMSANERARLRMKITEGRNAKRVYADIGKMAADAMKKAKDPSEEYTQAIYKQQQALDAGVISLDQFKVRKMQLLRTLRDAKAAQSGENEVLKQAGILVDRARSASQIYEQKQRTLKTALDRGKISQQQYNDALDQAQRELRETEDAQTGANAQLRIAAQLVNQARSANDVYEDKVNALNLALRRGKIDQQQYNRAIGDARRELQQAGVSGDKWTASLKGSLGTMVGIGSAGAAVASTIALIRSEYDHLLERQNIALDRTMTLAQAQEQAAGNLGDVPEMDVRQLFDEVREASLELGVNEVGLTRAITDALSARGNRSAEDAIDAVIAAAKLRRFSPEELPQLSGAALDISKGTGMGLEESLGFMMEVATQSRITSLKAMSENVAPSLTSAGQYKLTPAFAGSVSAALSQSMVDPTGQTTRTAVTKLFQQLRAFRPEDNVGETFRAIQADGDLRDEFFRAKTEGGFGASFEAKALPSIQALLDGVSTEAKQFRDSLERLSRVNGQSRFDSQVEAVDSLPAVQTARIKQITENMGEQLAFADPSLAVSAAVREGLKELRDGLGESQMGSQLSQLVEDFLTGANRDVDELIRKMSVAENRLLNPTVNLGSGGVGAPGRSAPRKATETELRQAAVLTKTIRLLEELQEIAEGPKKEQAPGVLQMVLDGKRLLEQLKLPVQPFDQEAGPREEPNEVFQQVAPVNDVGANLVRQFMAPAPGQGALQEQDFLGPVSVEAPEVPLVPPLLPKSPAVQSGDPKGAAVDPEISNSQPVVEAVNASSESQVGLLQSQDEVLKQIRDLLQAKPEASSESPIPNAKAAQVASVGRLNRRGGQLG